MAPPNNPRIAKVAMVYARDTRQFVNVFHVEKPTPWVAGDLPTLATIFKDWWNLQYRNGQPPTICLNQIQVRKLDPADPLAYDLAVSPVICGASGGVDTEPANVTTALSWRSGLAGRRNRGRTYVPGIEAAATNVDDTVIATRMVQYANTAFDLLARLSATTWVLAIFHRDTNLFTLVTSFVIDNLLDSQRRRLPGRGR